ncbi:MAG: hypothetical protein UZ05_CHB002000677 [Chlorobi bacterium OLB5]|nr:MAG: hypothetical protein UZ05_CHB002000677 [Chlorobi bacterium OLB5]
MKTTASLILFFISINIFTQSNRIHSISLNVGLIIPVEKLSGIMNSGYNAGLDIETRKNNFAVFAAGKLNIVKNKLTVIEFEYYYNEKKWERTIGEITAGGRWYLGDSKPFSANVDLAISIYTGNFFQKIPWGFQPGIGGNFNITKKLSANLNMKANVIEGEDWVTYLGFYSGVRYSF